jgi:thioredoxin 1
MQKCIVFFVLLFLVTACSNDEQPGESSNSVTAETQASTSVTETGTRQVASHKIIFFLNPNGGPCRQQLSILNDMAAELRGIVDIQYVQTSVPGDRALFSQYGIRGLPTLLLADASGKEIKRIPPGVKQADDIRLLINSIPQS